MIAIFGITAGQAPGPAFPSILRITFRFRIAVRPRSRPRSTAPVPVDRPLSHSPTRHETRASARIQKTARPRSGLSFFLYLCTRETTRHHSTHQRSRADRPRGFPRFSAEFPRPISRMSPARWVRRRGKGEIPPLGRFTPSVGMTGGSGDTLEVPVLGREVMRGKFGPVTVLTV